MPSAQLLALLERTPKWRRRARAVLAALVCTAAAGAVAIVLDPNAAAHVRTGLARFGVQTNGVIVAGARPAGETVHTGAAGGRARTGERHDASGAPAEDTRGPGNDTLATQAVAGSHGAALAPHGLGGSHSGAGASGARDRAGASAERGSEDSPASPGNAQLRARKLTDWLGEVAASAGRGLILAPDVAGDATAYFDDTTTWEERLAALARIHGFQYTVGERLIEAWVRPREIPQAETRVEAASVAAATGEAYGEAYGAPTDDGAAQRSEDLDDLATDLVSRRGLAPKDDKGRAPSATSLVLRPVNARAADLVAAVAKAARAGQAQVAADPNSNSVVIAGPEAAVVEIATLVQQLDIPRRRFVLEAEIVELSTIAREELGVRWSLLGSTVGATVDFPAADDPNEGAGILIATDGSTSLRARISALAADGHVRVVSRPRVVVLEGKPASIESVRILRVRYPSSAVVGDIDDGAAAVASNRAFEEIPVGVVLRVEPSMQGDGRIVLRIRAKSSTLGPPQPPDDIPEELSRMVDAEVAVADGETAVLGGLLREGMNRSATGVPVLRSVPVFGLLFGKREHRDEDEELVVFVTPRLLRP